MIYSLLVDLLVAVFSCCRAVRLKVLKFAFRSAAFGASIVSGSLVWPCVGHNRLAPQYRDEA